MAVDGIELIAKNIIKYGQGFLNETNKTMRQVERILRKEVDKNISRDTYTLEDLKILDHPYATRHGARGNEAYNKPYYQVHKRTGKFKSALSSGTVDAHLSGGQLTAAAFAKLDPGIDPKVNYIIFGTSKMIPRPVLNVSRDNVVGDCFKLIENNLRNFTFSFRGLTK